MLEGSGGRWKDREGCGGGRGAAEPWRVPVAETMLYHTISTSWAPREMAFPYFLWPLECVSEHSRLSLEEGNNDPSKMYLFVFTLLVSLPSCSSPRGPSSQACASGQDASQGGVCSHSSQADMSVPPSWVECSSSRTPNNSCTQRELQRYM